MGKSDNKGALINRIKLESRREERTVEELTVEIAAKNKEIEQLKSTNGGAVSSSSTCDPITRKKGEALHAEVEKLKKQLIDAEDKVQQLEAERDEASERAKVNEADSWNGARLVEARRDLAAEQKRYVELEKKHAVVVKASEDWQRKQEDLEHEKANSPETVGLRKSARRIEKLEQSNANLLVQLEGGKARKEATARAEQEVARLSDLLKTALREKDVFAKVLEDTRSTAILEADDERAVFHARLSVMEATVASLRTERNSLVEQLRTAKANQTAFKYGSPAPSDENRHLKEQLQEYRALVKRLQKVQHETRDELAALEDRSKTDAEKRLELTDSLDEARSCKQRLETRVEDLEVELTNHLTHYIKLLQNLRLSDDDVSTLLEEGSDWPPLRAEYASSSLIDLLWLVQDERTEASEREKTSRAQIRSLEEALEEARRELEETRREKADEGARMDEANAQLRERLAAFEANTCSNRSPSRSSTGRGGNGGGSTSFSRDSSAQQVLMERLKKKVVELSGRLSDANREVAELRDENNSLLFQLVGDE